MACCRRALLHRNKQSTALIRAGVSPKGVWFKSRKQNGKNIFFIALTQKKKQPNRVAFFFAYEDEVVWFPAPQPNKALILPVSRLFFYVSPIPVYSCLDRIFWTGFGRDLYFTGEVFFALLMRNRESNKTSLLTFLLFNVIM